MVVYKLTGSGNDFVVADGRHNPAESWHAAQIREICDRRVGLGADGFVVLAPGTAPSKVRFNFFNSDGKEAPMCGNGALCATRLARWLELVQSDEMVLETAAGDVQTRVIPGRPWRSELRMNLTPELSIPAIRLATGETSIHFTAIGVPHLVVLVSNVESAPVDERGSELRRHSDVEPLGANVNFVSRAGDSWSMRTYERGVEAETMACGTGAVACATTLLKLGEITLPWSVKTRSGNTLTVSGSVDSAGGLSDPSIEGEGRIVFRAVVFG